MLASWLRQFWRLCTIAVSFFIGPPRKRPVLQLGNANRRLEAASPAVPCWMRCAFGCRRCSCRRPGATWSDRHPECGPGSREWGCACGSENLVAWRMLLFGAPPPSMQLDWPAPRKCVLARTPAFVISFGEITLAYMAIAASNRVKRNGNLTE